MSLDTALEVDLFDYDLPPERIAQVPADARDAARLMVVSENGVAHRAFRALPEILRPGDLLVLNDTRVIPARLTGRRASGGRVEILVLEGAVEAAEGGERRCLLRASHRPRPGERLALPGGASAVVIREAGGGEAVLEFGGLPETGLVSYLERCGATPIPPYIRRLSGEDPRDRERYQTVYARVPGAVAAPTAGLHFTPALLEALAARGIHAAFLTLHVGPGTFRPVATRLAAEHRLDPEPYAIPGALVASVEATRRRGGRVVACGTTAVRALEHAAAGGRLAAGAGMCNLFILPGHRFRIVEAMITNFHLPRSTLLMLVAAFAGRERILAAYREAIAEGYRFYSYGDAMLLEAPDSGGL